MILLALGLMQEHLLPTKRKMDWIDHLCLWTIRLCLVILFLSLPHALTITTTTTTLTTTTSTTTIMGGVAAAAAADDSVNDKSSNFFFACSGGELDIVQSTIEEYPSWVNARTDNGESCLHLTGIYGHSQITEYLLQNGADPNIRSTYEGGLRMHPLSWNVYGGHYDNIELLLKYGANVNLDFDSMGMTPEPVTALDIVLQLQINEQGDDRFTKLETLLRKHGAKTMKEIKDNEQKTQEGEEL